MHRPRRSPSLSDRLDRRSEDAFSLLETMIVVFVLAIVSVAVLSTTTRASETAKFTYDRNDSLDQLRTMAASFSKDVRQAVQVTSLTGYSSVTMQTYVGGTLQSVTWRVQSVSGQNELDRIVGATTTAFVVKLTTSNVFSYDGAEVNIPSIVRVTLTLATQPDPRHPSVQLTTAVGMRNVP